MLALTSIHNPRYMRVRVAIQVSENIPTYTYFYDCSLSIFILRLKSLRVHLKTYCQNWLLYTPAKTYTHFYILTFRTAEGKFKKPISSVSENLLRWWWWQCFENVSNGDHIVYCLNVSSPVQSSRSKKRSY